MIKIIVTNTHAQVDAGKEGQAFVYDALSYMVHGGRAAIKRVERRTGQRWDGIKSLHNRRSKTFPAGLVPRVIEHLKKIGCPYEIVDAMKRPNKKPSYPVSLSGINLYDFQDGAARRFLTEGKGILKLGTGAGKTETACAIAKAVNVPMIFYVHRKNLMYQAAERFAERWPEAKNMIGLVGDGQFDLNYLTFAMVQTMHSSIKKYGANLTDDLKKYGLMVIDEAHRAGAKQFYETAGAMSGAYYRLGLTATPFMHEDPAPNLMLEGVIGRVIYESKPSDLIKAGVLAKPYFKFFPIHEPKNIEKLSDWRDVYEHGIVHNDFRNRVIAQNTAKLVSMGRKPLVIVQEINHGDLLGQAVRAAGANMPIVTGKNSVKERIKVLNALGKGHIDGIICSNIFDEGVDVKDVDTIVLAAGSKSAPSFFQRAGRAIRKKDDGRYALIVDFIDNQHPILQKHSQKRYDFACSEPEFTIL